MDPAVLPGVPADDKQGKPAITITSMETVNVTTSLSPTSNNMLFRKRLRANPAQEPMVPRRVPEWLPEQIPGTKPTRV